MTFLLILFLAFVAAPALATPNPFVATTMCAGNVGAPSEGCAEGGADIYPSLTGSELTYPARQDSPIPPDEFKTQVYGRQLDSFWAIFDDVAQVQGAVWFNTLYFEFEGCDTLPGLLTACTEFDPNLFISPAFFPAPYTNNANAGVVLFETQRPQGCNVLQGFGTAKINGMQWEVIRGAPIAPGPSDPVYAENPFVIAESTDPIGTFRFRYQGDSSPFTCFSSPFNEPDEQVGTINVRTTAQCADLKDNEPPPGDGFIDFAGGDPECTGDFDDTERPMSCGLLGIELALLAPLWFWRKRS